MKTSFAVLAVVALTLLGCGDDGSSAPETGPTGTGAATTEAPVATSVAPTTSFVGGVPSLPAPTTAPVTVSPATTAAPSSTGLPGTTTSVVCPSIGGRDGVLSNFPGGLTSLVGIDIRTGGHACFERIVIEFVQGDAPTPGIPPGYWVRYSDDPITLGQTDDQFVTVRGDAVLLMSVEAWMYEVDDAGRPAEYAGPIDLFPTNVTTIEEIRLIDNSEGVQVWAIGLDRERDLRVTTLRNPQRLVIDLGL